MLINNLVFALVHDGQLDEAERQFLRIKRPEEDRMKLTLLATEGLLNYRRGDFERGRDSYLQAIEKAKRINDAKALALASVFYAYEDLACRPANVGLVQEAIRVVDRAARRGQIPELSNWLERLKRMSD